MKDQRNNNGLYTSGDVVSTGHLLQTQQNKWKVQMSRLYYSGYCKSFYVLQIVGCLVCIGWTMVKFGEYPTEKAFLCIEVALSCMMVGEVVWRGYMQNWPTFLKEWANVVDLGVTFLVLASLIVGYILGGLFGDLDELGGMILLLFRTAVSYFRLIFFVKNMRKTDISIIDLNEASELGEERQHTENGLQNSILLKNQLPKQPKYELQSEESQNIQEISVNEE